MGNLYVETHANEERLRLRGTIRLLLNNVYNGRDRAEFVDIIRGIFPDVTRNRINNIIDDLIADQLVREENTPK